MKKVLYILLSGVLAGCDIWGDYVFRVNNDSESQIEVEYTLNDYPDEFDTSVVISAHSSKDLWTTLTETLGFNDPPDGIYSDTLWIFDRIIITDLYGDTLSANLRDGSLWNYSVTGETDGLYELSVTDFN